MRSILGTPGRRALVLILVAPLFLLWPSVFGGRTFVPYDLAIFPEIAAAGTEDLVKAGETTTLDLVLTPETNRLAN